MSTCISRHGEFSSHELDDLHTCTLCHVLDEDALREDLTSAREQLLLIRQERDQLREQVARPPLLYQADAERQVQWALDASGAPRLVSVAGEPWDAFPVLQQAVREQRGRIEELEEQRDKVLALHTESDGRCTHCVEWCDCPDENVCTHGNVEWPCPTAAIFSPALPAQGQTEETRS